MYVKLGTEYSQLFCHSTFAYQPDKYFVPTIYSFQHLLRHAGKLKQ